MRKTALGDTVVESLSDDVGAAIAESGLTKEEVYGIVVPGDDGAYAVEVRENVDGGEILTSDDIFASVSEARAFLKPHVSEVQVAG